LAITAVPELRPPPDRGLEAKLEAIITFLLLVAAGKGKSNRLKRPDAPGSASTLRVVVGKLRLLGRQI